MCAMPHEEHGFRGHEAGWQADKAMGAEDLSVPELSELSLLTPCEQSEEEAEPEAETGPATGWEGAAHPAGEERMGGSWSHLAVPTADAIPLTPTGSFAAAGVATVDLKTLANHAEREAQARGAEANRAALGNTLPETSLEEDGLSPDPFGDLESVATTKVSAVAPPGPTSKGEGGSPDPRNAGATESSSGEQEGEFALLDEIPVTSTGSFAAASVPTVDLAKMASGNPALEAVTNAQSPAADPDWLEAASSLEIAAAATVTTNAVPAPAAVKGKVELASPAGAGAEKASPARSPGSGAPWSGNPLGANATPAKRKSPAGAESALSSKGADEEKSSGLGIEELQAMAKAAAKRQREAQAARGNKKKPDPPPKKKAPKRSRLERFDIFMIVLAFTLATSAVVLVLAKGYFWQNEVELNADISETVSSDAASKAMNSDVVQDLAPEGSESLESEEAAVN